MSTRIAAASVPATHERTLPLRGRRHPFRPSATGLVCALLIAALGGGTALAEDVTYQPGAYIVDMGNATNNTTTSKGLLGYGFVYAAVRNLQVPVDWIIKPNKTAQGEVDFVGPGNKSYSTSAFIVSKDYASLVTALVATYKGYGAIIDGPTATAFVAPRYATLRSVPNILLDTQNGPIVETYLNNGKVTSTSNIYSFGQPTALDSCDDVFALPHADPTWNTHGNLVTFNQNKGFIWGACHAVSVLENLEAGDNPAKDALPSNTNPPQMNFLSNYSTVAGTNLNRTLVHYKVPGHEDGDGSYDYITTEWSNPFMQFLGDLGPATESGSEQIFLPVLNASWRSSTTIAVWDANHPDIPGLSPGKAAKLAWGRGLGNENNGMVMYLGGHTHNVNNAAGVAAQRSFFNFLLQAGVEKVIASDINVSIGTTACPGSTVSLTANATGGTNTFTYQWSSTCGGTFTQATGQNTDWQIPGGLANGTTCYLKVIVRDGCQRFAFQTVPVVIGDPKADLSVTVDGAPDPVSPGDIATFTIVAYNGGPETVTNATVDVTLPAGLTFLDANPAAQYNSGTGRWTLGTLATGGSAALLVRATVGVAATGTSFTVGATIGATSSQACTGQLTDPNLANNTDSDAVTLGAACTLDSHCDQTASGCDAPDTCRFGECVDNKAPAGTFCGSSNDDACDDRDTCDGVTKVCQPNFAPLAPSARAPARRTTASHRPRATGPAPARRPGRSRPTARATTATSAPPPTPAMPRALASAAVP